MVCLCRHLGVSPSGFYGWRDRGSSERALEDEALVEAIKLVHVGHKRNYGAPRVHKALRNQNVKCSKRRVNRLMKANGIESTYHASRPGRRSGGFAEIADNAFVESFFGTLKNELVHQMTFGSYVECAARIIDYVAFYNEERLQSSLGYVSPKA